DKPPPAGSRLFADGAAAFPKVSSGGRVYTFKIRSGMKFSNGVPITAKNYKAAIDRDANKNMQSPAVPFFSDIVGATDAAGNPQDPGGGVQATGLASTVRRGRAGPHM